VLWHVQCLPQTIKRAKEYDVRLYNVYPGRSALVGTEPVVVPMYAETFSTNCNHPPHTVIVLSL
jgi:hypothetical protein